MALPGVCPSCGAQFDLAAALTDAEARAALAAALDFPPALARLVIPYMGLHAPAGRRIAWAKLARLLRELTDAVQTASVTRNGIAYAAPLDAWRAGLEAVIAARDAGTLALPLEGHGYLFAIVHKQGSRHAGKAEKQAEEKLQSGVGRRTGGLKPAGDVAGHLGKLKKAAAK